MQKSVPNCDVANFIRHMVMWHWRWARDQNTVIGRW